MHIKYLVAFLLLQYLVTKNEVVMGIDLSTNIIQLGVHCNNNIM